MKETRWLVHITVTTEANWNWDYPERNDNYRLVPLMPVLSHNGVVKLNSRFIAGSLVDSKIEKIKNNFYNIVSYNNVIIFYNFYQLWRGG